MVLATFCERASKKARRAGLVAAGVMIFANSDVSLAELPQHYPSRSVTLPAATSDSRMVLSVVNTLLRSMRKDGVAYKKAGSALLDLARPEALQADLLHRLSLAMPL